MIKALVSVIRLLLATKWRLFIILQLVVFTTQAQHVVSDTSSLDQSLIQCRSEPSALLRLACYDNLFQQTENTAIQVTVPLRSDTIQKALMLEKQRAEDSVEFLTSQAEGVLSPEVIISTPALGKVPPRPILVFSCQDNITRMQIAFFEPLPAGKTSTITLKTSNGLSFQSHWFIRDNGLLLESGRGLPGIAEIQQLFNAETLSLESNNSVLNGLTFQINGLAKVITPLRQACRW